MVLSEIALCRNPHWIIFFRLQQGIDCGSVPVALVSSLVSSERTSFAMVVIAATYHRESRHEAHRKKVISCQ